MNEIEIRKLYIRRSRKDKTFYISIPISWIRDVVSNIEDLEKNRAVILRKIESDRSNKRIIIEIKFLL